MDNKELKHKSAKLIFLHLFPGIIILIAFTMFIPIFINNKYPNDMAIYLADVVVLAPLELGVLLYIVRYNTGTFSIRTKIQYLEKSEIKEYIIFIPIMAIWALLINAILNPFEVEIRDRLFSFVPIEYVLGKYNIALFTNGKILLTGIFGLLANGVVAPIVEEIYFRGYLLTHINLPPLKSSFVSAILFSAYHFYSPWYFLSRVLMTVPLYYWVIKKRNIRYSILAHIIANVITSIGLLLQALN